ncbi:MAG: hypothetical protein QW835_00075 [Candidatus Hadarchaeum sp.]
MFLRDFLRFPFLLKDREKKLPPVRILSVEESDGGVKVVGSAPSPRGFLHGPEIWVSLPIRADSAVLVHCTCESFRFEFCYVDRKFLLYPEMFIRETRQPPKKRRTVGGCKHLVALARAVYRGKALIEIKIRRRKPVS